MVMTVQSFSAKVYHKLLLSGKRFYVFHNDCELRYHHKTATAVLSEFVASVVWNSAYFRAKPSLHVDF